SRWGPVTVLVNNAGVPGPVAQTATMSTEDYLRVVSVDQHGVFFGMRAVIPQMMEAGGGSIVNIASMAGFAHVRGVPNPAYTAAKAAVRGLTRAAAVEGGPYGIRVNCVMPGAVATPMLLSDSPTGMSRADSADGRPLQRPAEPREVANVVAFLAALVNVILIEGLYDRAFVEQNVAGVDQLRAAVASFDPVVVARWADVPSEQLVEAARMF
nr:SDR family oxidoreductase [Micromonospora sp. DSM 115978]